jgi:hypothetical protein
VQAFRILGRQNIPGDAALRHIERGDMTRQVSLLFPGLKG